MHSLSWYFRFECVKYYVIFALRSRRFLFVICVFAYNSVSYVSGIFLRKMWNVFDYHARKCDMCLYEHYVWKCDMCLLGDYPESSEMIYHMIALVRHPFDRNFSIQREIALSQLKQLSLPIYCIWYTGTAVASQNIL